MKDLNNFLTEKEDRPLRKDEGADDKEYVKLMDHYKNVARKTMKREEANKYLEKALKLAREGDVSKDARLGAAYL